MAKTSIEWTDRVWNTQAGCSLASPGCTNCYAMGQAARNFLMGEGQAKKTGKPNAMEHYRSLTQPSKAGPVWAKHCDNCWRAMHAASPLYPTVKE